MSVSTCFMDHALICFCPVLDLSVFYIPPVPIIRPTGATSSSWMSSSRSVESSLSSSASPGTQLPDPPSQSDTSPPSEFLIFMNNPFIVTSLVLLIITLTVFFAVLCRLRRTRRKHRALVQAEKARPPPPDVYVVGPRRSLSLSINNVVLSPLRSPTPTSPRVPSPVLSLSAHSAASEFPSSDIHHVQRDLRGFSFAARAANSRPASRSSLGTTKTRRVSPVYAWIGDHPRQYGSLWDVEVGRWREVTYSWKSGIKPETCS
ncbi:hypothetical protein MVEN_02291900 [Mycena venus]|uniref:Uncharacterized protein n=1 Tax=Mycena venus TaxID=2733690 RepID=A0A8H7CG18_9AGAR|nr:hypothetical protein MVEN_02291900 [Mycena venus]